MVSTLLSIDLIGMSPYASRLLNQSLTPIEAATQMRRTINGNLIDISLSQFRKYRTEISGNDQLPPAFSGIYPGAEIVVDCLAELSYPVGGSPDRTVVSGSSRTEAGFVFYRPRLTMRVLAFKQNTDEWGAAVSWNLIAEEV